MKDMTIWDLMSKYGIPRVVARHIKPVKLPILVKTFYIYDINDKKNPVVVEFENLLKQNPNYKTSFWKESGPCSNWGYNVWRYETDAELDARIKYQAKNLPKALKKKKALLKRAKKKFPIKFDVGIDMQHFGTLYPVEIFDRETTTG